MMQALLWSTLIKLQSLFLHQVKVAKEGLVELVKAQVAAEAGLSLRSQVVVKAAIKALLANNKMSQPIVLNASSS